MCTAYYIGRHMFFFKQFLLMMMGLISNSSCFSSHLLLFLLYFYKAINKCKCTVSITNGEFLPDVVLFVIVIVEPD